MSRTDENRISDELTYQHLDEYPWSNALYRAVVAAPELDEPRRAYATWLRNQSAKSTLHTPTAQAWYMDRSLDAAAAVAANPRVRWQNMFYVDAPHGYTDFWGAWPLQALSWTSERGCWRGFVEHVHAWARDFLDNAEQLFTHAPIRQLSITHCQGLLPALLDSPYLRRLRGLSLPSEKLTGKGIINEWTDEDIEAIAQCPNLGGLRYLELDCARNLTARAFIALARSPYLRELSLVRSNDIGPSDRFGKRGADHRQIFFRQEVEAAVGYVPWLHAYEHYGWVDPMPEAVIEHPIALDPVIAARRGSPVETPERHYTWDESWDPERFAPLLLRSSWTLGGTVPPPDSLDMTPRLREEPYY